MKKIILILVLALGTPGCDFIGKEFTRATWMWDARVLQNGIHEVVEELKQHRINTVYIFFSSELDQAMYRDFIKQAHEENINVEALGGERVWGLIPYQQGGIAFIEGVIEYNSEASEKERFDAIHLDIEPYLLEEWEKNKSRVLEEWYSNTLVFIERTKEAGLSIHCDLPFWLDSDEVLNAQPISFEKPIYQLFIDMYDSVNLMSYRNIVLGENSISEISNTEINYAEKMNKKIGIAIDLLPSDLPYTTFANKGYEEMESSITTLHNYYEKKKSYQGVAIHDFDHLIKKR